MLIGNNWSACKRKRREGEAGSVNMPAEYKCIICGVGRSSHRRLLWRWKYDGTSGLKDEDKESPQRVRLRNIGKRRSSRRDLERKGESREQEENNPAWCKRKHLKREKEKKFKMCYGNINMLTASLGCFLPLSWFYRNLDIFLHCHRIIESQNSLGRKAH